MPTVRCPRCGASQQLGALPRSGESVRVVCGTCGTGIRVKGKVSGPTTAMTGIFPSVSDAPPPLPDEPADVPRWRVRKADGTTVDFPNLRVFQRWVVDGAVTLKDALSRNGRAWRSLQEIPELVGLFERVDALRQEGRLAGTPENPAAAASPELPPELPSEPPAALPPELPEDLPGPWDESLANTTLADVSLSDLAKWSQESAPSPAEPAHAEAPAPPPVAEPSPKPPPVAELSPKPPPVAEPSPEPTAVAEPSPEPTAATNDTPDFGSASTWGLPEPSPAPEAHKAPASDPPDFGAASTWGLPEPTTAPEPAQEPAASPEPSQAPASDTPDFGAASTWGLPEPTTAPEPAPKPAAAQEPAASPEPSQAPASDPPDFGAASTWGLPEPTTAPEPAPKPAAAQEPAASEPSSWAVSDDGGGNEQPATSSWAVSDDGGGNDQPTTSSWAVSDDGGGNKQPATSSWAVSDDGGGNDQPATSSWAVSDDGGNDQPATSSWAVSDDGGGNDQPATSSWAVSDDGGSAPAAEPDFASAGAWGLPEPVAKPTAGGFVDDGPPPATNELNSASAWGLPEPAAPKVADELSQLDNTQEFRAPSAAEMASYSEAAQPIARIESIDDDFPPQPGARQWLYFALGVLLTAAIGVMAWWLFGRAPNAAVPASDVAAASPLEGAPSLDLGGGAEALVVGVERSHTRQLLEVPESRGRAELEIVAKPAAEAPPAEPGPKGPHPEDAQPTKRPPKPETPKPETPKPETPKPETPKPETPTGSPADAYDALLREAQQAESSGQVADAIRALDKAAVLNPRSVEPISRLGWLYLKKGDNSNAIVKFQEARRRNPGYRDTYIGLAKALEAAGRRDEAIQVYRQYLQLCPTCKKAESVKDALKRLGAPVQ